MKETCFQWPHLHFRLSYIPDEGMQQTLVLPSAWLKDAMSEQDCDVFHPAGQDVTVSLFLHKEADGVRVKGSISFEVRHLCGWCVEEVFQEYEVDFDRIYLPAHGYVTDGATLRQVEEDLDLNLFEEEDLYLHPMLAEEVLLCLPQHAAVATDDQQRCVLCGKTREEVLPSLNPGNQDPGPHETWAALKQMKR